MMRAKDPVEFLSSFNSTPNGDSLTGTVDGVAWRIEPHTTGFTAFFLVKVGYRTKAVLSLKAAQRERDVLVEMFAPRIPA